MAEGIARSRAEALGLDLAVASAGTAAVPGMRASDHALAVCREVGVDLSGHRAQPVTAALVDGADHIFAMEHDHAEWIREFHPAAAERVLLLGALAGGVDIDDPYGAWFRATYRRTRVLLERAVGAFLARLA
jgi:protein-tyrosine phosphatase